ncbi:phosphoribosylformylglycinamidine synthase [Hypnocyclicus thermotrophus]|uniref:Phosphoribosylformylglycinamidine synthase n=1 Tax=Hypnocyclicus thermotrophus TaxID=1627895 RepID=A0AA46DZV8_9FUSO|nr:phosphoribosylformylglycinamidine synthase [Hypnocyclicus thermotrophus]TDT71980.1 phosphoribosylformylglycinamidine synthase [Hypnocyclicus thermotrophus]
MNCRLFVEKKKEFGVEANNLLNDFVENLQIRSIDNVRVLNIYDIFNIDETTLDRAKYTIFSEPAVDNIVNVELDKLTNFFATEFLPGQFDQRADSAVQCIKLISDIEDVEVRSGKLLILEGNITKEELEKIKSYYINPVETREKDLFSPLNIESQPIPEEVCTFTNFINFTERELEQFRINNGFAMSFEDIKFIQEYFKNEEKRDPTETEIKVLDTYWSDHCRHTTFETEILNVKIEDEVIKKAFENYLNDREYVHNNKKTMCLMDLATLGMKKMRKLGLLDDLEVSDEINACSIEIKVDVNGKKEDWLLMFKNETHNHPTEIEPFGGASTCIGGAIRDPLSGRAYVYQAMRISGAADITEKIEDTLKGKLPQRVITKEAAHGYSSYGNQIGLATTFVKEIYDEGYKAKRMEVGAVVGAVKKEYVRREKPNPGDIVILLGGKTGRDGCGGATGSSKEHNIDSIVECSAEVQKGNAPEERKIQRLFRNPEVTKLIKKSNDFGAGGVSVAIGELADGLEIDLDKVPVKYSGLNGTELAISESQERMSVVIEKENLDKFIKLANNENIEAVKVAEITDTNRLVMKWKNITIVDISREFLNTNGARAKTEVIVEKVDYNNSPFNINKGKELKERLVETLKELNIAGQKGLVEMFDATIGATTVLMPFGGKYQLSETEGSVQKIPVIEGDTNTVSVMTFGYNPKIAKWSPYHGAAYAVIESIAKVVALGADYKNIRFSFQEYFERLGKDAKKWGKPFSALLGALDMQNAFNLPAIGGKDSMSGTFNDLNVPPTLISFAVTTTDASNIISTEFKKADNYIYLVKHNKNDDFTPNVEELKENFDFIYKNIISKKIVSAFSIKHGGIAEAICKMSFGNKLGVEINTNIDLFEMDYGSIVIEATENLNYKNLIKLGKIVNNNKININGIEFDIDELINIWQGKIEKVFPIYTDKKSEKIEKIDYSKEIFIKKSSKDIKPKVFIPIFPGTNCEYDSMKAFVKAGADVETMVFRNRTHNDIIESINEMKKNIENSQIIMFAGGFSAGDEPDGSGKFIANILLNNEIKSSINKFLEKDSLILGICNGFQALVKSGLLPYGEIGKIDSKSPTLTTNNINRHVSQMVYTRIASTKSPWLTSFSIGDIHRIVVSHGEGKFVASKEILDELVKNGQIITQYVDLEGNPTMNGIYNPNGSYMAIEGIISKDGKIFGKMGHSERMGENLYKNIDGNKVQNIFENGVKYFK